MREGVSVRVKKIVIGIIVIVVGLAILISWSKAEIASEETITPSTPTPEGSTETNILTNTLIINLVSIDPGTGTARIKLTLKAPQESSRYEMGFRSSTNGNFLDYQTASMNCSRIVVGEKKICSPQDDIVIKIGETQSGTYPFDTYLIEFHFDVFPILDNNEAGNNLKSFERTFRPSDTKINRYVSKLEQLDSDNASIKVTLARPRHFYLLLLLIILSIPLALVLSIIVQLSSAQRELEALILNVTIFIGIPGIRGFLVPPELGYALWVDIPLLVSILLAFGGIGIFFYEYWKQQTDRNNQSTGQGS